MTDENILINHHTLLPCAFMDNSNYSLIYPHYPRAQVTALAMVKISLYNENFLAVGT